MDLWPLSRTAFSYHDKYHCVQRFTNHPPGNFSSIQKFGKGVPYSWENNQGWFFENLYFIENKLSPQSKYSQIKLPEIEKMPANEICQGLKVVYHAII